MSRNPAVTMAPTVAPRRSIRALVASVVPWMTAPTSRGASPARDSASRAPSSTPRTGSSGVVRTLPVRQAPLCSTATSVNVPPTSTPIRYPVRDSFLSICVYLYYRDVHVEVLRRWHHGRKRSVSGFNATPTHPGALLSGKNAIATRDRGLVGERFTTPFPVPRNHAGGPQAMPARQPSGGNVAGYVPLDVHAPRPSLHGMFGMPPRRPEPGGRRRAGGGRPRGGRTHPSPC